MRTFHPTHSNLNANKTRQESLLSKLTHILEKTCVEERLDYVLKMMLPILGSIVNCGWEDLHDHLKSTSIFTLTLK